MAIEADHYRETRARLKKDPIIQAMAREMADAWDADRHQFVHYAGTPRWWFMSSCAAQYRERGGTDSGHIGGASEAIVELLREGL